MSLCATVQEQAKQIKGCRGGESNPAPPTGTHTSRSTGLRYTHTSSGSREGSYRGEVLDPEGRPVADAARRRPVRHGLQLHGGADIQIRGKHHWHGMLPTKKEKTEETGMLPTKKVHTNLNRSITSSTAKLLFLDKATGELDDYPSNNMGKISA